MASAWKPTMTPTLLVFLIIGIPMTESQWGPAIEFDPNIEAQTQGAPNPYDWGQPHDFDQGANAGWGEPVTFPGIPQSVDLGAGWGQPIAVDPNHAIPQPNDQGNFGWGAPIAFDPTPDSRPHDGEDEHTMTTPNAWKPTENSRVPSRKLAPASCSAVTSQCGQCKCCFTNDVIRATCKGSNITDIPNDLPGNITHLTVEDTGIVTLGVNKDSSFPQSKFTAYPKLKELRLLNNEELSDMLIAAFFFNEHTDIESLLINGCPNLKIMKGGVLGQFNKLTTLKVLHTGLQTPPGWDLFTPGHQTLIQVDLSYNDIGELTAGAFQDNFKTGILTITHNNALTAIRDFAFSGSTIGQLDLSNNEQLVTLETHAFANIKEFYALDLSNTGIQYLPGNGLQTIERLRIVNTRSLQTFVSVLHFQVIKEAELTYQHHCCAFEHPEKQDQELYDAFMREMEQECTGTVAESTMTTPMMTGHQHRLDNLAEGRFDGFGDTVTSVVPRQRRSPGRSASGHSAWHHSESQSLEALRKRRDIWHKSTINPNVNHTIKVRCGILNNLKNAVCEPRADAFNPCEDVLGNVGLRFGCWFIVITALFGNLTVIIVSLGNHTKMNVSKLLISNLAFSDLILGLYLAVLAVFDLHSKSVYFTIAIPWQNNGGCQLAGFLAIFSTCLSVYTLTVITVERWYVIRNAIYSKRIRLRVASSVMVCGWVYSIVMAMLPLVGVSSYSKTSICLPMETEYPADLGYVVTLMFINTVCFIIISVCCFDIYRRVRSGSTPAGQSDVTVAKIMALLIITDFFCLFPIVFFGLTAAFGLPLISVPNSKILLVICFPLNSCANPFLYAIRMKHFRRDLLGMLSRCGYCEQRAAKYRLALTTNPMSYSQSRGSLSGTTQNLIHRPSVASTTLTSCVSQHNNKNKSQDLNYKEAYLNKQMTQESDLGSPTLSPTDNGYCPLMPHDAPVLVSDQRKLSVVIEDGLSPQQPPSEGSNSFLGRGDSSPSGSSRDDLDKRPCPRVRSVSEYSDRLLLKVPRHLTSQHAAENDQRKGSEATCLTELSDYSYHTNKSNSSADSGTNQNSPDTLRRSVRTKPRRQHKKSFPGDSGIADIHGAQVEDVAADDEETATNVSVGSAEVFIGPASKSTTQSAELVETQREKATSDIPEPTQGESSRKNLHPDELYRINNEISHNRLSLRTSPKGTSEGKLLKSLRASDGYFNKSYTFGEVPMCVQ